MNRTVVSPILPFAAVFLVCAFVLPKEMYPVLWNIAVLFAIPETIAIAGQFMQDAHLLRGAEFVLRISTLLRRPWLLLPGSYPLDVYLSSASPYEKALYDLQKYPQSLSVNSTNVRLIEERTPQSAERLGCELICRAAILWQMGNGDEARSTAEEAMVVLHNASETLATSLAMNNLAMTYLEYGETDKSVDILRKMIDIRKRLGVGKANLATAHGNCGYALLCARQYSAAEPWLREGLAMSGSCEPEFKASIRNNLGDCLRAQGRLEESEKLLMEALAIRRKSLSKRHPHFGYSYHNLANLMVDKGEYQLAEEYFQKALTVRTEFPGFRMKEFNETATDYVRFLMRIGRDAEAESLISVHKLTLTQS